MGEFLSFKLLRDSLTIFDHFHFAPSIRKSRDQETLLIKDCIKASRLLF